MKGSRRIAILAEIATVLLGLVLSCVLVKAFLLSASTDHPKATYCQPGKGISLKDYFSGVDWPKGGRTLILALSTRGQYRSESAPFYRRIEKERAKDVRLLAIFPESQSQGRKYLEEYGVHVDDVRHELFAAMEINATPLLILLDDSGTVTNTWEGELSSGEQEEVIAAVKEPPATPLDLAVGPNTRKIGIDIDPEHPTDALRFVAIRIHGVEVLPGRYQKPYLPGKPVTTDDTWLDDLSFTLRNRTSKTIVCLQLSFMFGRDDDLSQYVVWWRQLGEVPAVTLGTFHNHPGEVVPKGDGKLLRFGSGTEMTISLSDQAAAIRASLEDHSTSLKNVTRCVLLVDAAFLEDGMRWGRGQPPYWFVDKSSPNQWLPKDGTYFPGELNPMYRVNYHD